MQTYDPAGIEDITADIDQTLPVKVYNLSGQKIADSTDALPAGIYIIRHGNAVKTIAVK